MSKDDYERDRIRWQQKLDDASKRLADAEIINSGMNQIKAELVSFILAIFRFSRCIHIFISFSPNIITDYYLLQLAIAPWIFPVVLAGELVMNSVIEQKNC